MKINNDLLEELIEEFWENPWENNDFLPLDNFDEIITFLMDDKYKENTIRSIYGLYQISFVMDIGNNRYMISPYYLSRDKNSPQSYMFHH